MSVIYVAKIGKNLIGKIYAGNYLSMKSHHRYIGAFSYFFITFERLLLLSKTKPAAMWLPALTYSYSFSFNHQMNPRPCLTIAASGRCLHPQTDY
jgi:hypothetical protein